MKTKEFGGSRKALLRAVSAAGAVAVLAADVVCFAACGGNKKGTDSDPEKNVTATLGLSFSAVLDETGGELGYAVNKGAASAENVVVPASYNGLPVIEIGYTAFAGFADMKSVSLPASVKTIGEAAFRGCTSLESITVRGKSESYATEDGILFNSAKTELVAYPAGRKNGAYTLPQSVDTVGRYAFYASANLKNLTLTNSVKTIAKDAFSYSTGLEKIVLSEQVSEIPEDAFAYCVNLQSVSIPGGVTTVKSRAFLNCTGLTSLRVGKSVAAIEERAFEGCGKLVEIYNFSNLELEKGARAYGDVALYAREIYTDYTQPSKLSQTNDGYSFYQGEDGAVLLGYTGGEAKLVLPKDYDGENYELHPYAFYRNATLTELTIPDGVTVIGGRAFFGCENLASVKIGDGVQRIGEYAFAECNRLKTAVVGDGVSSIDQYAFANAGLTSLTMGKNVISVGERAFYNCAGLTGELRLGNSVNNIGNEAFFGCSGVKYLVLPQSVTMLGLGLFEGCEIERVFFGGTKTGWEALVAQNGGNPPLEDAAIYFYSETKPVESGAYWHFNEKNEVETW